MLAFCICAQKKEQDLHIWIDIKMQIMHNDVEERCADDEIERA